jgi:hypothetical protein
MITYSPPARHNTSGPKIRNNLWYLGVYAHPRRRNQDIPQNQKNQTEHRIRVYLDIAKPAAAKAQKRQELKPSHNPLKI